MQPCTECLGASCGDGLRQLATPEQYQDEYNENLDLIFEATTYRQNCLLLRARF